jgi:hypothetical protein
MYSAIPIREETKMKEIDEIEILKKRVSKLTGTLTELLGLLTSKDVITVKEAHSIIDSPTLRKGEIEKMTKEEYAENRHRILKSFENGGIS